MFTAYLKSALTTNPSPPDKADMTAMTAMYDSFISKFATNLGVTEDQVAAALKAAQLEMIDAAVDEGALTQEQADKMIERIILKEKPSFLWPGRVASFVFKSFFTGYSGYFKIIPREIMKLLGSPPEVLFFGRFFALGNIPYFWCGKCLHEVV